MNLKLRFLAILLIIPSSFQDDYDYESLYDDLDESNEKLYIGLPEIKEFNATIEIEPEFKESGSNDYLDEASDSVDSQESFGMSGAVELLPREAAEKVAPTLNVSRESPEAIARFANAHPYAIDNFTYDQLDNVLQRSKVIYMLNNDTIHYLVRSEEIIKKLEELPKTTIAAMISSNPRILTNIPREERVAAMNLTRKLLKDESFLARIPLVVHAFLAESSFRHHLTFDDVGMIIKVHPTLPKRLGPHGRSLILKLVHVPLFLTKLPCEAIITVAQSPEIMNLFESKELAVLARNHRVWECLPVDVIRKVIKEVKLGGKVGMGDLWAAARTMGTEKSFDSGVIRNVFHYQFSDFASRNLALGFYTGK